MSILKELVAEEDHKQLESLLGLLQRRKIKLFVGAGVTRAYGYPDWATLLLDLARVEGESRVPSEVIQNLKVSAGQEIHHPSGNTNFEKVAQDIEDALAGEFLHNAVDRTFQPKSLAPITGPTALSALAGFNCGPFFTTNFDPMLEQLVAKQHGLLEEEVASVGRYNQVLDAMANDDSRKVVKLHGTYNERNHRVLTRA